ncbi:MAG: serine/threonine-protein kinase [Burkholderiaceae bacterium]|nr:serine/threonine-protein kinase [Burkholderiaceae bacterium]
MENAELDVNAAPNNDGDAHQLPSSGSENCLPVGTRLSEFELTGIVGEGGFGSVYLAFDHSLQRTVAIKEYMPSALAGRNTDKSVKVRSERHQETFQTGLRSFINEARLLAQFDHPALIKVHRFWEENNTAYMAMRYYEGMTLKKVLTSHPELVTEAWLRTMLTPILEALETLYKINILHRDISPDNIMIQNTGGAVLLDFGAARQIIGDMTQALTVILKPGYAPVEQYADDPTMKQGPWTDIYALSAVLYAAIARKSPPTSVARMIKDPIELLSTEKYPNFSETFLSAVNTGLKVNPDARPQSIAEFRSLFEREVDPAATVMFRAPLIATQAAPAKAAAGANAAKSTPSEMTFEKTIEIVKPVAVEKAAVIEKSVADAKPTAVETAKPEPEAKAMDETVVMKRLTPTPPPEEKTTPAEAQLEPAKAAEKKPAPAVATAKSGGGKRALLAVGLLLVLGGGSYGGYLYLNRVQAPAPVVETPPQANQFLLPPPPPQSAPQAAQSTANEEAAAWEELKDLNRPTADSMADLANFIDKYPSGKFAESAKQKLTALIQEAVKLREDGLAFSASTALQADPNQPTENATVTGTIALTIKPWGNVIVDNVSKGASPPVKKIRLAEGKHQIKIVNASFPDYVVDIDVTKNKTVNIEHDFTAH